VLREAAERAPDAPALVAGTPEAATRRRWTYSQLLDEAERTARALLGRFEPGERVAVWAPNVPEWVVLEFGAACHPEEERRRILALQHERQGLRAGAPLAHPCSAAAPPSPAAQDDTAAVRPD
jgi:non-ribosomal peptide synthetase component E (peptide arylation enzyme)